MASESKTFEVEFSGVPARPASAREIRQLEITLIIGTIFREDVLKEILDPREFTTWLDSLAVAAGALAREKAGYTTSKIAEDLGRSESTIRNHLQGKTKAGKIVRETYEHLVRGKLKISIPILGGIPADRVKTLEEKIASLENELKLTREKAAKALSLIRDASKELADIAGGQE